MKIDRIDITNILGVRRAKIDTPEPIQLFCGRNGTGKSSLQECVRMALRGEVLRVDRKKDYALLVTEGAKEGYAVVATDGQYENSVALPKGEFKNAQYGYPDEIIASVLNAHRFASLSGDERRAFLFRLTGCEAKPDKIRDMLLDRKCIEEKIEAALPMLRAGFPAACEAAGKKATEAKGAWRAITGETYGSVKAAGWKAPVPEVDQEAIAGARDAFDQLNAKVIVIQKDIATREGAAAERKKQAEKLAQAKEDAGRLQRVQDKLQADEASLEQVRRDLEEAKKRAGETRRDGLVHDMYVFINSLVFDADTAQAADALLARYVEEFGEPGVPGNPAAGARIPNLQRSLDMLLRAIDNDRRDIAACQAAAHLLAGFGVADMADDTGIDTLREELQAAIEKRNATSRDLDALNRLAMEAAHAGEKTTKAAQYHADVESWSAIARALDADGIPSELLAQALKPINTHLRESASATGWMQVAIGADMSIRANGRLYPLLSESEKWRCDAMMAEAIARLADIRLLMLDRVDVLDLPGRAELLMWLDGQVQAGGLESALLFGTFKALPSGLPASVAAHWIEDGYLTEYRQAA